MAKTGEQRRRVNEAQARGEGERASASKSRKDNDFKLPIQVAVKPQGMWQNKKAVVAIEQPEFPKWERKEKPSPSTDSLG
jgi:hypothetical protein